MVKKPYKIRELAALMLAAIVVSGGAIALLTSPNRLESNDQKHLQQELQENAALLGNNKVSEPSITPVLPVPPTEASTVSVSAENNSEEAEAPIFTAIGDSVMLGAVPAIQTVLPGGIIDAKEFRQVWDVRSVIRDLDAKEMLLDTVIIALGGNGSFSKSSGQELINTLGTDRTIYWIAPYGQYLTWQESTLRILNELAEENENLTILDWPKAASAHTDWFYDDGMHLNAAGQTAYAKFILEQLSME